MVIPINSWVICNVCPDNFRGEISFGCFSRQTARVIQLFIIILKCITSVKGHIYQTGKLAQFRETWVARVPLTQPKEFFTSSPQYKNVIIDNFVLAMPLEINVVHWCI